MLFVSENDLADGTEIQPEEGLVEENGMFVSI